MRKTIAVNLTWHQEIFVLLFMSEISATEYSYCPTVLVQINRHL